MKTEINELIDRIIERFTTMKHMILELELKHQEDLNATHKMNNEKHIKEIIKPYVDALDKAENGMTDSAILLEQTLKSILKDLEQRQQDIMDRQGF